MYSLLDLEVTQVLPGREGVYVLAKHPGWHYEYSFFIESDKTVKGKTSWGSWAELTKESACLIQEKLQTFIRKKESQFPQSRQESNH